MEIILDFSLENTERMIEFEKYCKENNENDEDQHTSPIHFKIYVLFINGRR